MIPLMMEVFNRVALSEWHKFRLVASLRKSEQEALLKRLGKHKMGKSCLYFKQLADLDSSALQQLIAGSIAELRQRYG